MIKTYIVGSGFLSENLKKKITNSKIFQSDIFIENLPFINKKNEKFNLIINSFYPVRRLNSIKSYETFVKRTNLKLSKILDNINSNNINKIIYTSSSAIYGSIHNSALTTSDNNRNLYAGFKISAESLIKNFSYQKNIKLSICRIFNLYGREDKFSIIYKIKSLIINKKNKIIIYNNGNSSRDFIHIDDVVTIYKEILKNFKNSGIYDIGTGKSISVMEIINKMKINYEKILFKKNLIAEIDNSVANNTNLLKKIKNFKFKSLEKFLGCKRLLEYKKIHNKNYVDNNLNGSVIYGAGFSGKKIIRQMLSLDKDSVSYVVDDDNNKVGKFLDGIEIISFSRFEEIAKGVNIRNVVISIPSLRNKKKNELIKKLVPYCQSISSLPNKSYYLKNKVEVTDINNLSLDELFGKKKITTDYPIIKNFKNMSVLITGGAGSIGSEILKQILKANPKKIIILDHSEQNIYKISKIFPKNRLKLILGDIKDKNLLRNIVEKNNINYIFHAAAYKHVKFLEENIRSAIKNNIIGTLNILEVIKNKKIRFVFISTDKAIKPKNILGVTKRVGELLIQYFFLEKEYKKSQFNILRFGNVIGSEGSALPYFLNQIKKDLPIDLTHKNMKRYFMSIKEACNLVLKTSTSNYKNSICFLDMGRQIKIIDIINKMFEVYSKSNQKLKIKIIGNKYNEKLSEKLYLTGRTQKTSIDKIYLFKDRIKNKSKFVASLYELINRVNELNERNLKKSLFLLSGY